MEPRNDLPGVLATARRAMLAGDWRPDLAQMLAMSQDDVAGAATALSALATELGVEPADPYPPPAPVPGPLP